ncbi:MAG: hypothetical protein KAG96_07845 [Ichthyobacteriaceae bacterium]|nr:hypothetical protein [Ichthyobacteriaceae bacterium]
MKIRQLLILLLFFGITSTEVFSQQSTTVTAKDSEISDNLDLKAVASVFGDSKDLEDFERRLNDPSTQITNLDMNNDGMVDYLRVVETAQSNTHIIAIQAVLGIDMFQDVATIEVEKDSRGETVVQVVGDSYMYGPNYIIEPVFVAPPVIFRVFWVPRYTVWHSPWYWGYHPPYYHAWRPYPPYRYHNNVNVNINIRNNYRVTTVRRSRTAVNIHSRSRQNYYARTYPKRSFSRRNVGVSNRNTLIVNRNTNVNVKRKNGNRTNVKKRTNINTRKVTTQTRNRKTTVKKTNVNTRKITTQKRNNWVRPKNIPRGSVGRPGYNKKPNVRRSVPNRTPVRRTNRPIRKNIPRR